MRSTCDSARTACAESTPPVPRPESEPLHGSSGRSAIHVPMRGDGPTAVSTALTVELPGFWEGLPALTLPLSPEMGTRPLCRLSAMWCGMHSGSNGRLGNAFGDTTHRCLPPLRHARRGRILRPVRREAPAGPRSSGHFGHGLVSERSYGTRPERRRGSCHRQGRAVGRERVAHLLHERHLLRASEEAGGPGGDRCPGGLDAREGAQVFCAGVHPDVSEDALSNACLPRRLTAPGSD